MVCRSYLVNGTPAIVCTRGAGRRRCRSCGRSASLLCDHPNPRKKSGTCDRPLCPRCAVTVGPDRHHCPDHGSQPAQGAMEI